MLFSKNEIARFLNEAFETPLYAESFPLALEGSATCFVVCEKQEMASMCIAYPVQLQSQGRCYNALNIGSVSTKKDFKSRGLASRAVQQAIQFGKQNGFQFAFLFAEEKSLYEKNGFKKSKYFDRILCITKEDLLKSNQKDDADATVSIMQTSDILNADEIGALWRCYLKNTFSQSGTLSFIDFKNCLSIPGMKIVSLSSHGVMSGLFLYGKGADYKDVVHGIAFKNENDFLQTLKDFMKTAQLNSILVALSGEEKLQLKEFNGKNSQPLMLCPLNISQKDFELCDQLFLGKGLAVRSLLSK